MSASKPVPLQFTDKELDALLSALKVVAEGSSQLTVWALALMAGSIAVIVSTGYLRPVRKWRLMYLLFVPAWMFVGWSVYCGNLLSRRYMAAVMGNKEMLPKMHEAINADFICQLDKLYYGLSFFGLWLLLFLWWWVFADARRSSKKDTPP